MDSKPGSKGKLLIGKLRRLRKRMRGIGKLIDWKGPIKRIWIGSKIKMPMNSMRKPWR
jgi:hypothetical protein